MTSTLRVNHCFPQIECTDSGGASKQTSFLMNVTNVNEQPSGIFLSSNNIIAGNEENEVIATITGSDPEQDEVGGSWSLNGSIFTHTLAQASH